MKTKIIAHRGYSQKYPENTLVAFKKAKELKADGVELDVHMTSDKELVVHHDYYLDKKIGKDSLLFNRSFQEITAFDVGSKFNSEFTGEKIPTLKQAFDSLGKSIHYEIELKGFTLDFLERVMKLVKEYDLVSVIEFTSPHISLLLRLKMLYPEAKTGFFVQPFPSWMDNDLGYTLLLNNLKLGLFSVAHCPLNMISEQLVVLLRNNSIFIHAADCNSEDDIRRAYQLNVDQLSTNNLETALQLRNETD